MEERRNIPRYLCTDDFSDSEVSINNRKYQLISTNFNRNGIALYSNERLPEISSCLISFTFRHEEGNIELSDIPCKIKHRHETEVGCQYGIQFLTEAESEDSRAKLLTLVEAFLAAATNNEDRYGLE
ncbi:PilZ domain-containing protein [Aliikangiella marina]|uniref:PilZ domain-containing protein n=1 Tax=Aliikangiella marina TaxID=1712262 RepID=A0A545TBY5_9GAMM|nr:PilZ domain-containing protein [Aliikangiella marina]TQV74735.1 PilZ domain-containing protein [Aliikangiella marina]